MPNQLLDMLREQREDLITIEKGWVLHKKRIERPKSAPLRGRSTQRNDPIGVVDKKFLRPATAPATRMTTNKTPLVVSEYKEIEPIPVEVWLRMSESVRGPVYSQLDPVRRLRSTRDDKRRQILQQLSYVSYPVVDNYFNEEDFSQISLDDSKQTTPTKPQSTKRRDGRKRKRSSNKNKKIISQQQSLHTKLKEEIADCKEQILITERQLERSPQLNDDICDIPSEKSEDEATESISGQQSKIHSAQCWNSLGTGKGVLENDRRCATAADLLTGWLSFLSLENTVLTWSVVLTKLSSLRNPISITPVVVLHPNTTVQADQFIDLLSNARSQSTGLELTSVEFDAMIRGLDVEKEMKEELTERERRETAVRNLLETMLTRCKTDDSVNEILLNTRRLLLLFINLNGTEPGIRNQTNQLNKMIFEPIRVTTALTGTSDYRRLLRHAVLTEVLCKCVVSSLALNPFQVDVILSCLDYSVSSPCTPPPRKLLWVFNNSLNKSKTLITILSHRDCCVGYTLSQLCESLGKGEVPFYLFRTGHCLTNEIILRRCKEITTGWIVIDMPDGDQSASSTFMLNLSGILLARKRSHLHPWCGIPSSGVLKFIITVPCVNLIPPRLRSASIIISLSNLSDVPDVGVSQTSSVKRKTRHYRPTTSFAFPLRSEG